MEGEINELLIWQGLPHFVLKGSFWPPSRGVAIRVAVDFSDIGWGTRVARCPGARLQVLLLGNSVMSSTHRDLLGVTRCLKSMVYLSKGNFVIFQVDACNLLGIVNRGSPRLKLS